MKLFLSNGRRTKLMADLVNLSMPCRQAAKAALIPDDLDRVDIEMASYARAAINHAEMIAKTDPTDIQKLRQWSTFLKADLLTMEAYRQEAKARSLGDHYAFSRWAEIAIGWTLQ